MIKKILLLLLFVFSFFSPSFIFSASFPEYSQYFYLNQSEIIDDGLNSSLFTFQDGGNFLLNNTYKVFTSLSYKVSPYPRLHNLFWTSDGLYLLTSWADTEDVNTDIVMQGYVTNGTNSSGDISYNSFILNSKYSNPDYFAVLDEGQNFHFCFGYTSLNDEVCFLIDDAYPESLTGSLGFDFNPLPSQISSSNILNYLSNSPFGSSGGGGSVNGNIDNFITGDYVNYDCTWRDIFIALESEGYNKNICYGGLDNFDLYNSSVNYNPIPGKGLSVSQIWAWSGSRAWDTFDDWFYFWNGIYKDTSNNYDAMWESYPAVYRTYFQLYNTYKGSVLNPRTVLEYCNIYNTFTGDTLNNSAGGYFKTTCDSIVREKQTGVRQLRVEGSLYSGGVYTGDTPIAVNWSGVGNMSGLNEQKDGLNFIQDFFNLAKSKIDTVYSNGYVFGILPNYIVVFLLAIILFRFLSH